MKVIAAIDESPAARPVLAAARAVAKLFEASVEALHVREDGGEGARAQADAADVEMRVVKGSPVEEIVRAGRRDDVAALVLGARATRGGPRPAGHTSLEVITSVRKPVLVVPPSAAVRDTLRRGLAPMNGTIQGAEGMREAIEIACQADLELVVAHVHDEPDIPMFDDQPQHETEAWVREFLARYCPETVATGKMELRVGVPGREILALVRDTACDLVLAAWSQDLSAGHAAVVRELLERSEVPVLLVPVEGSPSRRGGITGIRTSERP